MPTLISSPDPARQADVPPPVAIEAEWLGVIEGRRPERRLTCQIVVSDLMDGLTLGIPEAQG